MKKNILMFFFCAALSAFSSAQAASAPVLAHNDPAFEDSFSGAGMMEAGASACQPQEQDQADAVPGAEEAQEAPEDAECLEEEGPGESALLYYEDAGRVAPDICAGRPAEELAPFISLLDEAAPDADAARENLCLDNAQNAPAAEDSIPGVPIVVNKNVESFIKYFQGSGRKYFEKWWDRSQHYMVMIREILQQNGMPEDLSYIAFIESGLNPKARSRSNAVGMWQFMKGTGVKYGLRVDWWIDERMDPEKATHAAARYFKDLYGRFGSWYLAAAGYNAGEGRVMRAVKKHGSDDFWELASHKQPFKRETKDYVPKYLAALMIAKDPVSYGFEEIEYREGPMYEKVGLSQATDLRVIARAAGTTVEEIQRLNPELIRWFTPPNYPGYEVKIPVGSTGQFVENMEKLPPGKKIAFLRHKIKRGDTLYHIARRYKTSVQPIMYLNNLGSARTLRPGTVLVIPVRAKKGDAGSEVADVISHWELPG